MNNKMDGEDKMILGVVSVIALALAGIIGSIVGFSTAANIEGNTIKVACIEEGKSLVRGDCIPDEKVTEGLLSYGG